MFPYEVKFVLESTLHGSSPSPEDTLQADPKTVKQGKDTDDRSSFTTSQNSQPEETFTDKPPVKVCRCLRTLFNSFTECDRRGRKCWYL